MIDKWKVGLFISYLIQTRRFHRQHPLWLLLDSGSAHTTPDSQELAYRLDITLVWLPVQCPELCHGSFMERSNSDISAIYQFSNNDEHASYAEDYVLRLTNTKALLRAGILSKNFWLREFL